MRKFYLLIVALCVMALSAQAGVKVLYNQNYQTVSDASASGWVGQVSDGLSIGSTDDGTKFVQYSTGANNDRSAHLIWGSDLLSGISSYTLTFYFNIVQFGQNHTTSEIAVMSNENTCVDGPNSNFRYPYITKNKANEVNNNWLFDLTQLAQYDADNKQTGISATGDQPFAVNGDSTNTVNLTAGMFYCVTLNVDTEAKTVEYDVSTVAGDNVTSGVYEVKDDRNMSATGLYYLGGRYQNIARFTEINIQTEVAGDFANKPTASLTGINNHQRVYNLGFMEGETLHYIYNGGEEQIIPYDDCDGNYVWSNNPNYDPEKEDAVTDACSNGTLEIWTTVGDAASEHETVEVSNDLVALPEVTADIVKVEVGFGKTYKLTASNADVPLQPTLFLDYTFTPESGDVLTGKNLASGSEVTLPGKGILTVTTKTLGYASATTTIENNIEYEISKDFNFAHMGEADFSKAGFSADGNVTGNYATYGRLYYYDAASYGETEEEHKAAKMTYSEIPQFTKKSSEFKDGVLVDGVTFTAIPSVNVHFYQGVGVALEGRKGDGMTGNWISSLYLTVDGTQESDIVAVSGYKNYGSNALHPVVADQAAFLASDNAPVISILKGTDQIGLYRISDCLARICVYSVKGVAGIKDVNAAEKVAKDDVYYTISGVKLPARPTQKGIYIKNGKAVVIK